MFICNQTVEIYRDLSFIFASTVFNSQLNTDANLFNLTGH